MKLRDNSAAAAKSVRETGSKMVKPLRDNGRVIGAASLATVLVASLAGLGAISPAQADSPLDQIMPPGESNPVDEIKDLMNPTGNPSNNPNMLNQDPKSTTGNKLNVTVGKGVVVSSDPSGKPLLTAMVANTQASGKGTRTVEVPMATSQAGSSTSFSKPQMDGESAVYDINNQNGDIQHFGSSNAAFKEKLPVSVHVRTWLDGKEVAPADMVNVTGHVKVSYTIKNETGVDTDLTYKNADGNSVTKNVKVPVPFGAALSTTLPFGFADVNAPWAQGGMGPTGMILSGTAMLFGPVPIIGGMEKTLTYEARATNASLPAVNVQAAPVVLSENKMANMALEGGPIAEQIGRIGANGIGYAETQLLKYHSLFMQYSAQADNMNRQYIKPIIRGFQDGQYEEQLNNGLDQIRQLDEGARGLNQLLPQATMVIQTLSNAVDEAVPPLKKNIGSINNVIDTYEKYMPVLVELMPQIEEIEKMLETMGPAAIDTLLGYTQTLKDTCTKGEQYLPTLHSFQSYLKAHPGQESAISLAIKTAIGGADGEAAAAAFDNFVENTKDVQWDTWMNELTACAGEITDELTEFLNIAKNYLPTFLKNMKAVINIMEKQIIPMMKKYNPAIVDFRKNEAKYFKMLDNNNCPKTPTGISGCGYMQQLDFLTDMMIVARDQVRDKMVPGLDIAVDEYLPLAEQYFALIAANVKKYGPEFERMLPNVIQRIENAFGMADGALSKGDALVHNFGDQVGIAVAAMEEMERRGAAGEGIPAGPAKGADTNLGAYQFALAAASDQKTQNFELLGLAALMAIITLGAGTFLYRRNQKQ
ncbi:MAG: hypothetical protein WAS05_04765 [Candidatus Nanopelagicales bacterium]